MQNIVLVITDDQGYPPLGCHGHPFVQTPNIDAFYQRAARFTQFHVGPTCAPTRASLLSGQYANSTGVWHTIGGRSLLRRSKTTLAMRLGEKGYRTGLFGKWHLGDTYPYRPQDRGFQHVVYHGGGGIGQTPDYWGNDYFDDTYFVNGTPEPFSGYCTDVFFKEGMQFIEDQSQAQPFFCYISTNAPHAPLNVSAKYRDLYNGKTDGENHARFLGMITNIDDNFGKLIKKLTELGLDENTLVVFMSDNGQCSGGIAGESEPWNAGMRGYKNSEYEGGHRVPFFIAHPSIPPQDLDSVVNVVDFVPSILDFCKIPQMPMPPSGSKIHGQSFLPLLYGKEHTFTGRITVTDSQRITYPVKWRKSCVLMDQWRLVNRNELYHLAEDPAQEHDIAAKHPLIVQQLRKGYEIWWDLVSEDLGEEIPILIGDHPALFSSHDLRNENCQTAFSQKLIRRGLPVYGYWEAECMVAGSYLFTLQRWPREAGHAINAGIEGSDVLFRKEDIQPENYPYYEGGKPFAFETAFLRISGQAMLSQEIQANSQGATFEVALPKKSFHLYAGFSDHRAEPISAYYVYVEKLIQQPAAEILPWHGNDMVKMN